MKPEYSHLSYETGAILEAADEAHRKSINQLPPPFDPLPTSPPRRIVCAALMHRGTGRVMVGIRHYCPQMRDQIQHSKQGITYWKNVYQGFVDQYGKFHTREEAWKIAEEQGQIRQVSGTAGQLFSEDLY